MRCFTVDYRLLVGGVVVEAKYRKLSEDDKLAILADYENGVSMKQLEIKYDLDRVSILRLLDSFGMERQSVEAKRKLLQTFENDYEIKSESVRAFCKLVKMAYSTAVIALEEAGKVVVAKKYNRTSQETKEEIYDHFRQGKSAYAISKLFNLRYEIVKDIGEKAGLLAQAQVVTPHAKRVLDYFKACFDTPVYKTAAEMASDLNMTERAVTAVLGKFKVTRPDMTFVLMKWLGMNGDPSTGFIKPIHYRTLSGLLNISSANLRSIIYGHPHWSLVIENGVIRDTRDVSDTSFLYQDDDDWDFESDQESFDDLENVGDFGSDEDFVEPAPPLPQRRSEPRQPKFSTGLKRSKKSEG